MGDATRMEDVSSKPLEIQQPVPIQTHSPTPAPIVKIIVLASIAAGIQFGWALQLSLLTPYVQLLGIPHDWAPLIWLCGPISGMIVQPLVGYYSDRSRSRFGRRRPFIAAGAALVAIAVILIGFAADIGHRTGDDMNAKAKPRAIAVFVVGFWILDVANNMLQGPCRAFLADLAAGDQKKTRTANAFFSFFMAVGNVLGFAAGSFSKLHHVFPFTNTAACDVYCANLKSCFFLSIILLLTLTTIALFTVSEPKLEEIQTTNGNSTSEPFFKEIFGALKDLPRPMWILLLVTCLNWIAWFPFLLFDTDWMGVEVYGGVAGKKGPQGDAYGLGVRAGALGLMLNSVVLGATSLGVEYLARALGGTKRLWGVVNVLLAVCLVMTVPVTKVAQAYRHHYAATHGGVIPLNPQPGTKAGALTIFSVLGVPLAITYSIPFAMASIYCSSAGGGQGLSLGVLNLAIVIPQMVISLLSGQFDQLFGGGNLPAFVLGSVAAAVSALLAFIMLPTPPGDADKAVTAVGGFH